MAIEPPETIKDQLIGLMEGVAGARWQTEAQLHLTVRYIGEVDGARGEDAALALSALRHPGFEVRLEGVGAFEKRGRVEALWAGVTPAAPLKSLHDKVSRALASAAVPPDPRAYLPHITIARLNGGAGGIGPFMAAHGGVTSAPWPVEELVLFESHLGRAGAHYEAVARYPLG